MSMFSVFSLLAQKETGLGLFEPVTKAFSDGSALDAHGCRATTNLELFISNTIGALTIIGGLFLIFYFIMGGLNWITAGGEQGKIQKARDQMIQGITGMVLIVISYALLGVIGTFLGLKLLNPGTVIIEQLNPLGKGTLCAGGSTTPGP